MDTKTSFLDNIAVAAPCQANWDEMDGDERTRHCQLCKLNVFNLSGMTRPEAEKLVQEREGGRLCVRFYRRTDGTVLTKNCPVGLLRIRRRLAKGIGALAAVFTLFLGLFGVAQAFSSNEVRHKPAFSKFFHWLDPDCSYCNNQIMGKMLMGDIAVPVEMGEMMVAPAPAPTTIPGTQATLK